MPFFTTTHEHYLSHDLALVAEVAHSITVMYAGQVVEQASTVELMTDPRHEYTRGLLGSVLSIEAAFGRLHQVPGAVPSPKGFPSGDRFAPRSSHPHVGSDVRPVMRRVEGSWHFYADHPEGYAAIAAAGPVSAGSASGVGLVRGEGAALKDGRPTLKTEEKK